LLHDFKSNLIKQFEFENGGRATVPPTNHRRASSGMGTGEPPGCFQAVPVDTRSPPRPRACLLALPVRSELLYKPNASSFFPPLFSHRRCWFSPAKFITTTAPQATTSCSQLRHNPTLHLSPLSLHLATLNGLRSRVFLSSGQSSAAPASSSTAFSGEPRLVASSRFESP
jgi:hypothetical protein